MSTLVASLLIFLTVLAALGFGILAGYAVVNAILYAFGPRAQRPVAVLVRAHTAASGD